MEQRRYDEYRSTWVADHLIRELELGESTTKIRHALAGASAATVLMLGVIAAPTAVAAPTAAPSAATGVTWDIDIPGCVASQTVELMGTPAHDDMRWELWSNNVTCVMSMVDNGTTIGSRAYGGGDDGRFSSWYYDGPGHSMKVCVLSVPGGIKLPHIKCGPLN